MQSKIKNPYEHKPEEVSPASREIIEVAQKAFEQGVKAALASIAPKRISEQMPEEGQDIILIHEDKPNSAMSIDKSYQPANRTYWMQRYTHWLPYPTLD